MVKKVTTITSIGGVVFEFSHYGSVWAGNYFINDAGEVEHAVTAKSYTQPRVILRHVPSHTEPKPTIRRHPVHRTLTSYDRTTGTFLKEDGEYDVYIFPAKAPDVNGSRAYFTRYFPAEYYEA